MNGPARLALLLLACAAPAAAFESNVPGHRIHEAITREAAAAAGWEGRELSALVDAVNDPDFHETELVSFRGGRLRFLAPSPDTYAPEHHFDRGPGASHAEAFLAGAAYVRSQRAVALDADARGDHAEVHPLPGPRAPRAPGLLLPLELRGPRRGRPRGVPGRAARRRAAARASHHRVLPGRG